jgi:hypothetical protein
VWVWIEGGEGGASLDGSFRVRKNMERSYDLGLAQPRTRKEGGKRKHGRPWLVHDKAGTKPDMLHLYTVHQ